MTEMKAERLQLRIDRSSKRHLEEAAEAAHLSLSSFVLQAAQRRADEVLADRALIGLDEDAATAFLEALDAPAEVNTRLLDALQRPVKVDWID
jgi:uncharacterized protein (DUF1778 family)